MLFHKSATLAAMRHGRDAPAVKPEELAKSVESGGLDLEQEPAELSADVALCLPRSGESM